VLLGTATPGAVSSGQGLGGGHGLQGLEGGNYWALVNHFSYYS
jgi:hypothetical protein